MRRENEPVVLRDQPIVVTVASWRRQIIALAAIIAATCVGAVLVVASDWGRWVA